jgi:hypothetical protein
VELNITEPIIEGNLPATACMHVLTDKVELTMTGPHVDTVEEKQTLPLMEALEPPISWSFTDMEPAMFVFPTITGCEPETMKLIPFTLRLPPICESFNVDTDEPIKQPSVTDSVPPIVLDDPTDNPV